MKLESFKPIFLIYFFTFININNLSLAQNSQLSCQATVNQVIQEIRDKGVDKVNFSVIEKFANESGIGNPTNRSDHLVIIMTSTGKQMIAPQITNVMSSSRLMNTWANRITKNCANTAIVSFAINHTDAGHSYYIQADGTTKREICVSPDEIPFSLLPWGVSVCL